MWTIDCFVGAYLTFPLARRKSAKWSSESVYQSWWQRWKSAWKVRWRDGRYKVNFDLHRAGGLWPWAMLFVLAWSSVAFNMNEVYHPVMKKLFTMQVDPWQTLPKLPNPLAEPGMSWPEALSTARRLMAELAEIKGFAIHYEESLGYEPNMGIFFYQVKSDLDINGRQGYTRILFNSNTGQLVSTYFPTTEATGDTITV